MFKLLNPAKNEEVSVVLTLPQVNLIAEAVACWKVEFLFDGGSTHEKKYKDMEEMSRSLDLEILNRIR